MTSLMKAYIEFSNKDKLRVMEVAEELEIEEIHPSKFPSKKGEEISAYCTKRE